MKDRLPALDGLRGLAAIAVALSHSGYRPQVMIQNKLFLVNIAESTCRRPNSGVFL